MTAASKGSAVVPSLEFVLQPIRGFEISIWHRREQCESYTERPERPRPSPKQKQGCLIVYRISINTESHIFSLQLRRLPFRSGKQLTLIGRLSKSCHDCWSFTKQIRAMSDERCLTRRLSDKEKTLKSSHSLFLPLAHG